MVQAGVYYALYMTKATQTRPRTAASVHGALVERYGEYSLSCVDSGVVWTILVNSSIEPPLVAIDTPATGFLLDGDTVQIRNSDGNYELFGEPSTETIALRAITHQLLDR